jgi:hypothetical protein
MIKSELIQKIAATNQHLYHRDIERIDSSKPKSLYFSFLEPCQNGRQAVNPLARRL